VTVPRIELADPGPEGQRIAEALRGRGFYVVERSVESFAHGTDAALLLLAGDVEGALEALRRVRSTATTATTPVILLGEPPLPRPSQQAIVELGADAYYPRPVPVERLVRKVETYLSPPETRLRSPRAHENGRSRPLDDGDEELAPARVEATLQLGAPSHAGWGGDGGAEPDDGTEAGGSADAGTPTRGRDTARPPAPSAGLSPRLRKLFLDADRRVFPSSPPLDLSFPTKNKPAMELVPDELRREHEREDPEADRRRDQHDGDRRAERRGAQRSRTTRPVRIPSPPLERTRTPSTSEPFCAPIGPLNSTPDPPQPRTVPLRIAMLSFSAETPVPEDSTPTTSKPIRSSVTPCAAMTMPSFPASPATSPAR